MGDPVGDPVGEGRGWRRALRVNLEIVAGVSGAKLGQGLHPRRIIGAISDSRPQTHMKRA